MEIERKFLVKGDFKSLATKSTKIIQGYISSDPERTVRIRIKDKKGFITIKGIGKNGGISRFEWEKEIPTQEACDLLKLCHTDIIEKTRYEIQIKDHIFEVDEFHGNNSGLVIAEIELNAENEYFEKPEWLDKEVTGETKYYNSSLTKKSYNKW